MAAPAQSEPKHAKEHPSEDGSKWSNGTEVTLCRDNGKRCVMYTPCSTVRSFGYLRLVSPEEGLWIVIGLLSRGGAGC